MRISRKDAEWLQELAHVADALASGYDVAVRERLLADASDAAIARREAVLQSLGWTVAGEHEPADKRWMTKARQAGAWIGEHGWPRPNSADADERSHGRWLNRQRTAPLTANQRAYLDKHCPGWSMTLRRRVAEQQWDAQYARFATWVQEHGLLPRWKGPVSDEERRLGKWLCKQRAQLHAGTLSPRRHAALTGAHHGWAGNRHTRSPEQVVRALSRWSSEHGRLPRYNDDRALYIWFRAARRRRDEFSEELRSALEALPGWAWELGTGTRRT